MISKNKPHFFKYTYMTQTAVEYIVHEVLLNVMFYANRQERERILAVVNKAKAMEAEQLFNARKNACNINDNKLK